MVQTHTVGDQVLLRIKQMIKIMPLPRQSPLIGWSTLTARFLIIDLFELTWLPLINRRVSASINVFYLWRIWRLSTLLLGGRRRFIVVSENRGLGRTKVCGNNARGTSRSLDSTR